MTYRQEEELAECARLNKLGRNKDCFTCSCGCRIFNKEVQLRIEMQREREIDRYIDEKHFTWRD